MKKEEEINHKDSTSLHSCLWIICHSRHGKRSLNSVYHVAKQCLLRTDFVQYVGKYYRFFKIIAVKIMMIFSECLVCARYWNKHLMFNAFKTILRIWYLELWQFYWWRNWNPGINKKQNKTKSPKTFPKDSRNHNSNTDAHTYGISMFPDFRELAILYVGNTRDILLRKRPSIVRSAWNKRHWGAFLIICTMSTFMRVSFWKGDHDPG
jgi:hypothetical protein